MPTWQVKDTPNGLRLSDPIPHRALGAPAFTWEDLFSDQLSAVQVYVLYFPSRFKLPVDTVATSALVTFGQETGPATSVDRWDPTDPQYSQVLTFFGLEDLPALVMMRGRPDEPTGQFEQNAGACYAILLTDEAVLSDRERLAKEVNRTHEVLMRGDPHQIAAYVQRRQVQQLLALLSRTVGGLLDEIVKLKPKIQVPGGPSLQLGG